jgi:hypothetical protein
MRRKHRFAAGAPSECQATGSEIVVPPSPENPTTIAWTARRGFERLLGNAADTAIHAVTSDRSASPVAATIPAIIVDQVRIAVADSHAEIEAARCLVRRRYAWRGYEVEHAADPAVIRKHPRHTQEITFIAANRETTIGTVTLGVDGPFGLRADETHGEVIRSARNAGCRVCELTGLAVAESVDSKSVMASLFSLVYAAGRTLHDVTDVFIEVNPRHVAYYSRILGFVVAAGERLCERVRAPSVLLHLEIEVLAERLGILPDPAARQPAFAQAA